MLTQAFLHASRAAFRRTTGLFVAASALTLSAAGQTADTAKSDSDQPKDQSDKVVTFDKYEVVSGFASSLAAAAEAKHGLPVLTEDLAAEDIGKLPEISIADSLARLPGLTTQRTNGRSQAIYIRGFTPDYSTGLLNGLQQVSTNDNRGVEYDQYPAELLSGVTVYKSAAPELVGQGLAGTIDLHTVRPLSMSGRQIVIGANYDWTQLPQLTPGLRKDGEHAHASYIDQFANNTVGVAIGFAHTSTPYEGEQFQAWGYPTDPSGNYVLGGTKSYVRTSVLDRNALMATLQFKPNDNIESSFDFYYTKFKENDLLRGMEIPLAYWSSANLQPGYTVTNGLATKEVLTNVQPVIRNDTFVRTDNLASIDWNLAIAKKSDWPTTFDAGYSRVNRSDENLETYSGLGFRGTPFTSADTVTVTTVAGQIPLFATTVDYTNPAGFKISDPQGWGPTSLPGGGMDGYLKYFKTKDELGELRAQTTHKLGGIFTDLELGVAYTDRYKKSGQDPTGYVASVNNTNTEALPPIIGTTDLSFLGIKGVYAYDPNAALASGKFYTVVPNTNYGSFVGDNFQVWEKIGTFFTQVNLKGKLGDVPFFGSVGFQAIHTDQSSAGLSANGSTIVPVSAGAKYNNFDPSLNLNFTPFDPETVIRFSVARQTARPRMYDMRASRNFSYDPTLANSTDLNHSPWGGGSGNPAIKPWLADAIDLSIEHYFKDNNGYIALAGFDKKLLTYIYDQNSVVNFAGYPVVGGPAPALSEGISSTPVNGSGGNVRGLEATLSLTSELLTGKAVKGFGLVLNGAYTDSTIQPWGPGNGTAPIAGLARKVANVTLYYERSGFSARVSERYRSQTREYITTFGPPAPNGDTAAGSGYSQAQPETILDAQVSYGFTHGPLKGLEFFLLAYNLTNEPVITYNNGDPRQLINYQKYGASYSAGAAYKF